MKSILLALFVLATVSIKDRKRPPEWDKFEEDLEAWAKCYRKCIEKGYGSSIRPNSPVPDREAIVQECMKDCPAMPAKPEGWHAREGCGHADLGPMPFPGPGVLPAEPAIMPGIVPMPVPVLKESIIGGEK